MYCRIEKRMEKYTIFVHKSNYTFERGGHEPFSTTDMILYVNGRSTRIFKKTYLPRWSIRET